MADPTLTDREKVLGYTVCLDFGDRRTAAKCPWCGAAKVGKLVPRARPPKAKHSPFVVDCRFCRKEVRVVYDLVTSSSVLLKYVSNIKYDIQENDR